MATLLDYTQTEFPNHTVELWRAGRWTMPVGATRDLRVEPSQDADRAAAAGGIAAADLDLTDHTVVAHVIGADATLALLERLRATGWTRAAALALSTRAAGVPAATPPRAGVQAGGTCNGFGRSSVTVAGTAGKGGTLES